MGVDIYGPLVISEDLATDAEVEAAIDTVENTITVIEQELDARLDVLEANSGVGVYVHIQDMAAAIWTIAHNLGYYPNVTTVDTLNREIMGDEQYLDANTVQVTFSAAVPGKAYLS